MRPGDAKHRLAAQDQQIANDLGAPEPRSCALCAKAPVPELERKRKLSLDYWAISSSTI
jgi:hypothetical protein